MGPDHSDELDAGNSVQEVQQINRPVKCNKTTRRDSVGTDVRPGGVGCHRRRNKLRRSV